MRTALASLFAGVLVIALLFAWSTHQLAVAERWVDHTHEVSRELDKLLADISELESGARGYILTGQPSFLAPPGAYQETLRRVDHLAELTRDNPEQQARVQALRPMVQRRVDFFVAIQRIRGNSGFEAAQARVASGEGRELMSETRQLMDQIQVTEDALLAVRTGQAHRMNRWAWMAGGLLMGLLLFSSGLSYRYVRREMASRAAVERTLRESEARFRLMVENVQDYAIFMLDPEGRIATWNAGAQRNKGYAPHEIIGKHFSVFYPPEDVAAGKPAHELEVVRRDGRVEDTGWRVRKDGSRFWANVIITALRDETGRLIGYGKVTRDLTERRAAEAQQEALVASLQRSNRELQDFAMVASHDLQEPLRKIQMFGDRLAEQFGATLGPTGQDYLRRMQNAAARGQSLILGLLAYSRVTTKAQPFTPVDLSQVASEVVSDLEGRITQVHGKVEYGELPTVEADPLQMRQLLQNLIGNALKFHRPDVPPVIRVSARSLNGHSPHPADGKGGGPTWELRVEDNGIGFDEKYLDRIFKLFQRLHERGVYEGAGMGLAICRKIVERHRGQITAHSAPGEGSTFIIQLPEHQPKVEVTA